MKSVMCSRCGERPAIIYISRVEGDKTTPEGLCFKCAKELNIAPLQQMIDKMGLTDEELEEASEQMESFMENMGDFDFSSLDGQMDDLGSAQTFPLASLFGGGGQSASSSDENAGDKKTKEKRKKKNKNQKEEDTRKFLGSYCTDLTKRAREGKIDIIIGRDKEISRTTQILCRRTKNNPCLIGEPGVGKTAIAEGLALRIAQGKVPARLADKEIFLLDLTALVAGTQFRGQFEGRIKGLVDEVKAAGNIILFIDEVHNLVGTGDSEGTMNAANILKPALSRGEIQVIGATTFNEYRKHIEKDAALERRFQPVKIEEPSIEEAYQMLLGIKSYYEKYHRVEISDTLVHKAVTLSERFITDRFLPDKAIDLLDEACTSANLRNKAISENEILEKKKVKLLNEIESLSSEEDGEIDYEQITKLKSEVMAIDEQLPALAEKAKDNKVTEADLAKVIHLWTGIPASKVQAGDLKRLASLEENLKKNIIGQDKAIELVANAVRRSRVQISPRRHPASFIFVGPTGVGKTELVKRLADELFDSPETLIRLDMSEFMEKFSVSRIIGSPPGYVGYDEAGQLTEKVRRKPYSVILFDEIEKAHPDVLNILLQILDEGRITDAQGRTVNFENTLIVMTSNAGSEDKNGSVGFEKTKNDITREKTMKALGDFLRPEFLGRVDEVVIFNHLTIEDFEKISVLMLNELLGSLGDKGISLDWDEKVPLLLAKKAFGGKKGARDLRDTIRRSVEDRLATEIVDRYDDPITSFHIAADDELTITSV